MSGPVTVPLPRPLVAVRIIRRVNRFAVLARRRDRRLYLYLPNSGRMTELLRPGTRGMALLTHRPGRTAGTLLLVRHGGRWVGMDARWPNRLFEAALRRRALAAFRAYAVWRREVPFGGGRIDFVLRSRRGRCLVETKSCNRVDGGVALFPDAPTRRGARHLEALARAAARGRRAAVVWFVLRDDARLLRPFVEADPAFARAARRAAARGVMLAAYTCRITPRRVVVLRRIAVRTN
ncbi:MAG: DNA/RNA nuclease SfsA [Armatimonadota bacterium]|nr:DNA/RNA nuclease SfsA [Armatimonadota bacterium]MDR7466755.1 DNA/RNA nuclease SfsA [Armatimonadota bacterium]MDR7492771.1 DNA/RNA nuclease SfsA [Armatimonadota bacterium]MDR7498547.1 DNA/RNA nuclease SfsA [Armatimonadota bacterium]MDR7504326.1 DNA/RNA nuclease SfsA [Armatimonadota bacterium]